jgi:hypothetical protein
MRRRRLCLDVKDGGRCSTAIARLASTAAPPRASVVVTAVVHLTSTVQTEADGGGDPDRGTDGGGDSDEGRWRRRRCSDPEGGSDPDGGGDPDGGTDDDRGGDLDGGADEGGDDDGGGDPDRGGDLDGDASVEGGRRDAGPPRLAAPSYPHHLLRLARLSSADFGPHASRSNLWLW